MHLVSKISKLCGPDPPTSQTDDRQTDDMQSQYRAMHYSASRGKTSQNRYLQNLKTEVIFLAQSASQAFWRRGVVRPHLLGDQRVGIKGAGMDGEEKCGGDGGDRWIMQF